MAKYRQWIIASVFLASCLMGTAVASAQQPGWSLRVVTFGETRRQIESTPILQRPYRPLHFYGNTVRRRHYRGTALPAAAPSRTGNRR